MSCSSCSCRRLCSSSSSSSLPLDLRLMSAPASIKPQYRESFVYQFDRSLKISMLESTGQFDLLNKQRSIFLQTQKTFSKITLNKTHPHSLPYGYQASYKINKKLNCMWVSNQATVLDRKAVNQCNRKKELRLLALETWGLTATVTVSIVENRKSRLHLYFYLDPKNWIWINTSNGKLNYINLLNGHSYLE